MANKPKTLVAASLPTASTLQYTVPPATTTIVKNILMCNTTAADITLDSTMNGVTVFSGFTVKSKETLSIDISMVMETGKTINTTTSAVGLSLVVSGLEVS